MILRVVKRGGMISVYCYMFKVVWELRKDGITIFPEKT